VLKIKQGISTHGTGLSRLVDHRLLSKDEETILCDTEFSQDDRVQKTDGSLQQPHSLVSQVSQLSKISGYLR
jgi:hypothetical protein